MMINYTILKYDIEFNKIYIYHHLINNLNELHIGNLEILIYSKN